MPPTLGRRGSERKPHQRRESSLPEEVRCEITRKLEKPYVPPTRLLTSEDIAARREAESSGEEDTSDAYYLRLHDAELAKKDDADKAAATGAPPHLPQTNMNFTAYQTKLCLHTGAQGACYTHAPQLYRAPTVSRSVWDSFLFFSQSAPLQVPTLR
jgi:hypothetical protein